MARIESGERERERERERGKERTENGGKRMRADQGQ
jgi:hypothetical protein